MEVAAPWSNIHQVYKSVRRAVGEHVVVMAHLSHAYADGSSIYFTFAGTEHAGRTALEVYDRAWRTALAAAIDAGATLSHHHGVGRSKAPRLPEELGAALGVVRGLKAAWDPQNVLNPGVLIPAPVPNERASEPEPPSLPTLDRVSALAELPGSFSLGAAESFLRAEGHTLGLELAGLDPALTITAWIAQGMPGTPDRFADPVRTPLSGFCARLSDGRRIAIRPSPRRAVGPDLSALFVGMQGAFGTVERAALLALPLGTAPAKPLPFAGEREPELDPSERAAIERLASSSIFGGSRDHG
jgi:alkyldihydroxyacetonephosphate synthase